MVLSRRFGGFIVPPGYTDPVKFVDGNPHGTSHAAVYQGKRVATVIASLKAGKVA